MRPFNALREKKDQFYAHLFFACFPNLCNTVIFVYPICQEFYINNLKKSFSQFLSFSTNIIYILIQ